jgi:hypothetical protein
MPNMAVRPEELRAVAEATPVIINALLPIEL